MSKTSDLLIKVFQLISYPLGIITTVILLYGYVSAYLNDFWKGFMAGVLCVFLPMLIINLFATLRSRQDSKSELSPSSRSQLEVADAQHRRDRIYAPLYDELSNVEKALVNYDPTNTSIWREYNQIKGQHIAHWIPKDLRNKISRLFEVELKKFHQQRERLENRYRKIIVTELIGGLIPVGGRPDTIVTATSDSNITALKELAIYLCRGNLPLGTLSLDLENAFKTVKSRSRDLSYNNVKELFNRYLQKCQIDEEYQSLNEQRKLCLKLAKDIKVTIGKDLEP